MSVLKFASESSIESFFAWGFFAVILLLLLSGKDKKHWPEITENPWFYFFLTEALLTFIAVLLSSWVAANGAERRYFTTFFISAWICFILYLGNLPKTRWKNWVLLIVGLVIITGSLSGSLRFYYPEIKPSRMRVLSAMRSMGNIGIIAEYWNSYLTASPDPVHVKATPHDKDYVRNPYLVTEVFMQPKIYLIKDGWLDSFPDTIIQFGRILRKKGNTIHIADAWMNRYEVIQR